MSVISWIRRHKLLFVVGVLVVAVLVAAVFYLPRSGERLVATGTFSISANSMFNSFSYAGTSVNQSMQIGCSIPASMKIVCESLTRTGTIAVFINDQNYATGTITGTGEVMLSSGCGCSTVCICEIEIGDNTIKISSSDFAGQLKYEIYARE